MVHALAIERPVHIGLGGTGALPTVDAKVGTEQVSKG